jgi:beta-galactosidase
MMTVGMVHAASAGETVRLDNDWKFKLGDTNEASETKFDDTSWRTVRVPHDYSIEGPPGKDATAMEGPFDKNSPAGPGGGYLNGGIAWYRKTFTTPESAKGKHVAVVFDGVYMDSDVYLNGSLLGKHPYGYTPFEYDLTDKLNFDRPNVLAVRCNVEQPCSRWYSGAGIFRPVRLVITAPVHIALWGTYLTTEKTGETDFTVKVRTAVRNDSDVAKSCKVSTKIAPGGKDASAVAEATSDEQSIPPHGEAHFTATCKVPNAKLWSPDEPNLYRAVTSVIDGKDTVDSVTDPLGFRTIEFTKDDGLHLNDKRVQIKGVCDHHDLGALGSAVNRRAIQRQLELLKGMGCNALRTSHNPPATELLDLADEMGFVVMDEAFDEWKHSKTKRGYGRFFDQWSESDLASMIHRDRNHPSVIMWSIGNEIYEQGVADGGKMAKRLADIAHREDPTRPVTSACNKPNDAVRTGYADALDVMGINYNIANYNRDKGRVLVASETASALSTRGEYGLYLDGDEVKIKVRPTQQCTSYDMDKPGWGHTAETSLTALAKHPWVAGEFVWTGFDYIGEPTPYDKGTGAWPSRSSYFGILDLAGFPKDRYYIYQSQWSDKPMVHILPHWNWEEFAGKEIPVWAYTNADEVELLLNGESLGSRTKKDLIGLHYEWKVPFKPGTLKAVAKKDGKVVATDEVITAGAPAKLELSADRPKIHADGDDLSFVTVRVLDKDGHVCPDADNEISFSLDGPASLAGVDNGDPTNVESFQGTKHKAFHGLALAIVRSKDAAGTATLKATAEGLAPASATIATEPVKE